MVAIFTGLGAGFERGSPAQLGGVGLLGGGTQGRGGDNISVNAATGNLLINRQDEFLVGRGPDVGISRIYNSLGALDENGDHWRQGTDRRIYKSGNDYFRVSADGSEIKYALQTVEGEEAYWTKEGAGSYDKMTFDAGTSEWTWTDGDSQNTDVYEADGVDNWRIISHSDNDGITVTYEYTSGNLTKIETEDGGYLKYTWSGNNITSVEAYADGGSTKTHTRTYYAYDGNNRLVKVTTDLSPDDNSIADGSKYETNYTYDDDPIPSNRIASISQTDGSLFEIEYDGSGRVEFLKQTAVSGNIRQTSFSYTSTGETQITDPSGVVTILHHDANEQLTRIQTLTPNDGNNENNVYFEYDEDGNVTRLTDSNGDHTDYTYDRRGNQIRVIDPTGQISIREYDTNNNLIKETKSGANLLVNPGGEDITGWQVQNGASEWSTWNNDPNANFTAAARYSSHWEYIGEQATFYVHQNSTAQGALFDYNQSFTPIANEEYIFSAYTGAHRADVQVMIAWTGDNGEYAESVAAEGTHAWNHSEALGGQQLSYYKRTWVKGTAPSWATEGFVVIRKHGTEPNQNDSWAFFTRPQLELAPKDLQISKNLLVNPGGEEITGYQVPGAASGWGSWTNDTNGGHTTAARYSGYWEYAGPEATFYIHQSDGEQGNYYDYNQAFTPVANEDYVFSAYTGAHRADVRVIIAWTGDNGEYAESSTAAGGDSWNQSEALGAYQLSGYKRIWAEGTAPSWATGGYVVIRKYATNPGQNDSWAFITRPQLERSSDGVPSDWETSDTALVAGEWYQGQTQSDHSSSVHTYRYVYDAENHLRYSLSAEGHVTEYIYHANGQLHLTKEYSQNAYTAGFDTPSESQMNSWRDALSDRSNVKIYENVFDVRGNLSETINYSSATSTGDIVANDAVTRTFYTRDSAGQLLSTNNASQQTETFAYDGLGRLISSSDLNGGTTTITFDDAATTTTVTSSNGYVTTSTYNKAGDLISQSDTQTTAVHLSTGTQTFKYDKNGRLRMSTDAQGTNNYYLYNDIGNKVADISYSGYVVEYRYDENGQQIATARYGVATNAANVLTLADPDNTLTIDDIRPAGYVLDIWQWTAYDDAGRVVRTILGDGSITTYDYDFAGRLVSTHGYFNKLTSAQGAALVAGGLAEDVTLPSSNANDVIVRTFYDRDGRVIGALNGEGHLSQVFYDKAGQKIQDITFSDETLASLRAEGSFTDLLASITPDATKDISVRYIYNGQGQLRFTIDALNQVNELIYGAGDQGNSLVRQTISYAAPLGTLGSYTLSSVETAVAALGSTADNRTSWTVYNDQAQLAYSIDASGAVIGYTYDSEGNVVKTVQYEPVRSTTSLPTVSEMDGWAASNGNDARITRHYYNARNELSYTVDAEGYVQENDYNVVGRLSFAYRWTNKVVVDDNSTLNDVINAYKGTYASDQYVYDERGNVTFAIDTLGTTHHYFYWANGELAWDIEAYGQAEEVWVLHKNDAAGRKASSKHYLGDVNNGADPDINTYRETFYYYDGLGNLDRMQATSGTHDAVASEQNTYFTHDKNGQVLTTTDSEGGISSFTYDAFGNVETATDARGFTTTNTYDQVNRLTKSIDARNDATDTTYTTFGEIDTVVRDNATTSFTYDKLGRVLSATDAEGHTESYTYNAYGQRETITNKLGGVTTNSYDQRGQLVEMRVDADVYNSNGDPVASEIVTTYAYDSRGNRVQMIEADGLSEARTTSYVYDAIDRLIEKQSDAVSVLTSSTGTLSTVTPTEYYTYDRRNNMIESEDANGARMLYFYDRMGRVTHQLSPTGTLTRNFYDAYDNVMETRVYEAKEPLPASALSIPPDGGTGAYRSTTFTYDDLNRMIESRVPSIQTAEFGTSLTVTTSDLVTAYEYDDNGNVIKVTDPNGNATYSYYDGVGNKTDQVDSDGYLTSWAYDPDGNVTQEHRYSTQFTGTMNTSTPPTLATHVDDRITEFGYDENGRRVLEVRRDVVSFDGSNASLATVANQGTNYAVAGVATNVVINQGDSNIQYTYNGLGQVTQKIEATGDQIDYLYDDHGRLNLETRSEYVDHLGGPANSPTMQYLYNGLNDVSRIFKFGKAGSISNAYTLYNYGAGGRLDNVVDASGFVRTFRYDAKGQTIREEYARHDHDDSSTINSDWNLEAKAYAYDLEGRIVEQGVVVNATATYASGTWSGGTWSKDGVLAGDDNDTVYTNYNAFGQVSERGMNNVYAEQFSYDNAGRLWKTNTGDGAYKIFMYDQNGNQTLAMTSDGTDLEGYTTLDAVLDLWGTNRADIGTNYVDGVVATITKYDTRNQAVEVLEPQRQTDIATFEELATSRTYNAFGDITSETDARSNTIDYTYNTMGRRIKVESPAISITNADGSVDANHRPTEHYYYDVSGRLVANRDANNYLTQQTLLAGTGYNGTEALITSVTGADAGVITTEYDIQGNARKITDQLERITTNTFDIMGRLTQVNHAGGLIDFYSYDELGQQIIHYNNLLGWNPRATTTYDQQGRVISLTAMGGITTNTSYDWDGTISTDIVGTSSDWVYGGWTKTTTFADGRSLTETSDVFGHQTTKNDLGGHNTDFNYDFAGRLNAKTITEVMTYTYLNTGKLASMSDGTLTSTYGYDKAGNLTAETLKQGSIFYKDASTIYDALGRMTSWTETGNTYTPAADIAITYDANGNVRSTAKNFRKILDNQSSSTVTTSQTDWFAYDSMNRVVTDKGDLDSGQIVRGSKGIDIVYDAAGQRQYVISTDIEYDLTFDPITGEPTGVVETAINTREDYDYDSAGHLDKVFVTLGTNYVPSGPGTTPRADYTYDLMGRMTQQIDYHTEAAAANPAEFRAYDKQIAYNDSSQILSEDVYTIRTLDTWQSNSDYTYDAVGNRLTTTNETRKNLFDWEYTSTTNTYVWFNGAQQDVVTYDSDTTSGSNTLHTTTFIRATDGDLIQTDINDGRPRDVYFKNDLSGQVIERKETSSAPNEPRDVYYRYGGKEMGRVSNNGDFNMDYAASISDRTITPDTNNTDGAFRHGSTSGSSSADFDQNYQAINSYDQGSTAGDYVVRGGETLSSIAAQVYGDSSLWYKIAQANGLSADAALVEGTSLRLPAGVTRNTYNASTFKPYDPGEAIGDVSPTTPEPPKNNKCGTFGIILLAVVAIAVTLITYNPATGQGLLSGLVGSAATATPTATGVLVTQASGLTAVLGGAGATAGSLGAVTATAVGAAAAGAVGSIASQGLGVATGIQQKFSWSAVANAALQSGGSAFLGGGGFSKAGAGPVSSVVRAAGNIAVRQGLAIATGGSGKIGWAALAAAQFGITPSSVGSFVGEQITSRFGNGTGATLASGSAEIISSAATRSALEGSNFGDNVVGSVANVVAQAIDDAAHSTTHSARVDHEAVLSEGYSGGILDYFDQSNIGEPTLLAQLEGADLLKLSDEARLGFLLSGLSNPDLLTRYQEGKSLDDLEASLSAFANFLGDREIIDIEMSGGMYLGLKNNINPQFKGFILATAEVAPDRLLDFDAEYPSLIDSLTREGWGFQGAELRNSIELFKVGELNKGQFVDAVFSSSYDFKKWSNGISSRPSSWELLYYTAAGNGTKGGVSDAVSGLSKLSVNAAVKVTQQFTNLMNRDRLGWSLKAKIKGYDINLTRNGGPNFANTKYLYPVKGNQKNIVTITMTGSRRADRNAAWKEANFKSRLSRPSGYNYIWHHLDDYNPNTNSATMQLVRVDAHEAAGHNGAVAQYQQHHGVKYRK